MTSLDLSFTALKHAVQSNQLDAAQIKLVIDLVDDWYASEKLNAVLHDPTSTDADRARAAAIYLHGDTK